MRKFMSKRDVVDLRTMLWSYYESEGKELVEKVSESGEADRLTLEAMVENGKGAKSDGFMAVYIDERADDVIVSAANQWPEGAVLEASDLPSTEGMVIFSRPQRIDQRDGFPTIVGGCWKLIEFRSKQEEGRGFIGVVVSEIVYDDIFGLDSANIIPLYHNGEQVGTAEERGFEWGAGASIEKALASTFMLLKQGHLKQTTAMGTNRAERRRASKAGARVLDKLNIIQVPSRPGAGGGDSDVEWACQWLVRGHWRNQWHPSLKIHKAIWISPYIKGPDDKPMKDPAKRVYQYEPPS